MKKRIILLIIPILIMVTSISYGFFVYYQEGNDHKAIAGSLFMDIEGDDAINITGMYPMTDEEGIENGVKYNFSVSGYNTTDKDIYYGVYVVDGDEISGKTRFKHTDIKVYLEETINGETKTVYGPVNLHDFNESLVHVNTVDARIAKDSEITIDYTLTMWIDQRVLISDTEKDIPGRSIYTTDEFKNSYASLKVEVEGLLEKMNMPLSIETSDTFVENNKAYFYATISNYHKSEDLGKNADDELKLEISGTNSDIVFSYKDSEGNVITETSETLDLNYLFNKNKSIEIQVFVSPKNDANATTDVSLKLTQNGEVKQNIIKTMNIFGNNFCLNNGFNKLYDCILASDSLATDVETAKVNIEAKGEPNLNDTAPTYTYIEDITYDASYPFVGTYINRFYYGDSYKFDETNGTFSLYNADGSGVITDALSDNYKDYYTCGGTNLGYSNCSTVFRIKATSVSETTYAITHGDKITYKVSSSIRSEVGLYKTEDDYGNSYVFRGDVNNNNVSLGGYNWKIIRTNGDNSIRLIYNGDEDNKIINGSSYTYSNKYPETDTYGRINVPNYVGYMYGKNFEIQTSAVTYHIVESYTNKFYFGDSYEFDEETEKFMIKKDVLEPIAKTFEEMNGVDETTGKKLYEIYPYTCKSTKVDGLCETLIKVNSIPSYMEGYVQYISYSSSNQDDTKTNEISSNAKKEIDKWYETNIVNKKDENGKLITDYIVDGTFCNDRSATYSPYNSGYLMNIDTYYGAYLRITASTPSASLKCNVDVRDKFSNTTSKGNGLLSYPVALITADEYILAGGKCNVKNNSFYLNTVEGYWTMSPSYFASTYLNTNVFIIGADGTLYAFANVGYYSLGLRPVINLRSDVLISSGDGTIENPFQLKLA